MASRTAGLTIEIDTKVLGVAAVGAFAKSVISAASDSEQAMGGLDAVFKQNSGAVKSWADNSAKSIGLSKTEYATLATLIGSQLKAAGTSMEDLAPSTDKLINLGADLAAQFGGSTADAVSAVSALLKGERDPIEKYGVSIKQADVNAEKLALGLTGLTGAADKQADAQATMSILMRQTADATGANAREADTAAGKQARLTAAFSDAKAAIGAELLPAFGKLMDAALGLVDALLPLVVGFADFAAAVASLPAPLLLAGAGLVAFLKYGTNLGSNLSQLTKGAMTAGDAFKGLGKSLAIGGAVGVGVAALGVIMGAFQSAKAQAEDLKSRTNELADAIVSAGGKWTKSAADLQESQFKSSGAWKLAQQAGISFGDAMALATGQMKDQTKQADLLGKADDYISNWDKLTHSDAANSLKELNGGLKQQATEANKTAAEIDKYHQEQKQANDAAALGATVAVDAAGAQKAAADAAKENAAAAKENADAQKKAADALAASARAAAENALANSAVSRTLSETAGQADAAKRSLDFLSIAMDKAAGRDRTLEQTTVDLNTGLSGLGDAFKQAADKSTVNQKALLGWNVSALTSNQAGQGVYKQLNSVRDAFTAQTNAAYQSALKTGTQAQATAAAAKAAADARAKFLDQAGAMGLTRGQAEQLAVKLGIVADKKILDKNFKIVAADKEAADKLKAVQDKELRDKTLKVNADTTQAEHDLANLERQREMTIIAKVQQQQGFTGWGPTPAGKSMALSADPLAASAAAPMSMPAARGLTVTVPVRPAQPVVNVYGALDPVAVARQIQTLLTGQTRRAGGVRVGGQAAMS